MKKILSKFKIYFLFIGIILISILLLSLLNTFGVPKNITNILSMIIMILTFLITGISKGKNCEKNGYLQGLKIGSILILILILIGFISFNFNFKTILYYLILLLSSVFGAMIGINKKVIN